MTVTDTPRTPSLVPVAAGAGAAGLVFMLIGTYLDTPLRGRFAEPWGITTEGVGIGELLLLVLFAVVGVGVVFGLVGRWLRLPPERAATRSAVLAASGVFSLIVFWTGLPAVIAAGAALLALDARSRLGRTTVATGIALTLAALTLAAAAWISISG